MILQVVFYFNLTLIVGKQKKKKILLQALEKKKFNSFSKINKFLNFTVKFLSHYCSW